MGNTRSTRRRYRLDIGRVRTHLPERVPVTLVLETSAVVGTPKDNNVGSLGTRMSSSDPCTRQLVGGAPQGLRPRTKQRSNCRPRMLPLPREVHAA